MTCWIGIDHGSRRIGIAVGRTGSGIASPLKTITAGSTIEEVIARIGVFVRDYNADGIVVGWPLNMDGTEGVQGETARSFADALSRALAIEVRLWDERLSTYEAASKLSAHTGKNPGRRCDAVAASIILEDFFRSGEADFPGDAGPDKKKPAP